MPAVKNVGEPCAREPHARFEVAAGGNQASRASTCRAAQAPLADPTKRFYVLRPVMCSHRFDDCFFSAQLEITGRVAAHNFRPPQARTGSPVTDIRGGGCRQAISWRS